jgi:TRAP-type C4-dicarboxylate transport system permease small subunit
MAGLPISQGADYLPLAVGGVLIAIFGLEKLVRLLVLGEEAPLVAPDAEPSDTTVPGDRPISMRAE